MAKIEDASFIAKFQLDMAAESEGATLDYSVVLEGVKLGIKDENKGIYLLAKDSTNTIVGSLMITRELCDWNFAWYWWIQSVYVLPSHRRKGVYRLMYCKVKEWAEEQGISVIRLYVDKTNQVAQHTYKSVGMRESRYILFEEEF